MIDELRTQLAVQEYSLVELSGQVWIDLHDPSSLNVAETFRGVGGRLIAISGQSADGGEADLSYHYDLAGKLYIVRLRTADRAVASIVSVFPGADWHEREVHEKLGVEFTMRGPLAPLLRSSRLWPRGGPATAREEGREVAG